MNADIFLILFPLAMAKPGCGPAAPAASAVDDKPNAQGDA